MTASMSCQKGEDPDPLPAPVPTADVVAAKAGYVCGLPKLQEKSGICQGENGLLYVIQDSADEGNDPRNTVTVVDAACKLMGTIKLKGVKNVDFEAVACGGGMVHVGDIGDNDEERDDASILSFQYPADNNATVAPTRTYFKYSDGPQNAEGLAWQSDGLLIVTKKWGEPQKLYRLKGAVASPLLTLPINSPIGDMSLSLDGRHFLFAQDESDVFHVCDWNAKCEAIKTGLSGDHEGVTWAADGSFLFTSEDEPEMYRGHVPALGPAPAPAPAATPVAKPPAAPVGGGYKLPPAGVQFQILDEDDGEFVGQLRPGIKLVNIELFAATRKITDAFRARGVYVVCYYNQAYQPGNPDIKGESYEGWKNPLKFPSTAIGCKMSGYNENWTDPRSEALHQFMDQRDILARNLGCDAVEGGDNMDDGSDCYGLNHNVAVLAKSAKRRADHAHSVGLAHFTKNTPQMSKATAAFSDGVFIEQGLRYDEMQDYDGMKGKAAYAVEYPSGTKMSASKCKEKAKAFPWVKIQYHPDGDYFNGDFEPCN